MGEFDNRYEMYDGALKHGLRLGQTALDDYRLLRGAKRIYIAKIPLEGKYGVTCFGCANGHGLGKENFKGILNSFEEFRINLRRSGLIESGDLALEGKILWLLDNGNAFPQVNGVQPTIETFFSPSSCSSGILLGAPELKRKTGADKIVYAANCANPEERPGLLCF
jgi:hypothetical protein